MNLMIFKWYSKIPKTHLTDFFAHRYCQLTFMLKVSIIHTNEITLVMDHHCQIFKYLIDIQNISLRNTKKQLTLSNMLEDSFPLLT